VKDQLPTHLLTKDDATRVIAHVREQNLSLFVEDTGPTRVGPELDGPTLNR
jgi:heat shock protein HspQ